MVSLDELRIVISNTLQDSYFTSDMIDALINESIEYCAHRVLLPELESSGLVSTSILGSEVPIPVSWNFSRNLYNCSIVDYAHEIQILDSLGFLIQEYPQYKTKNLSGQIEYILMKGDNLIYYPIPDEVEELNCDFYRTPPLLVNDADIPTCLPAGAQKEIIENYVLRKCYSQLEDGIEGPKSNTKYYEDLFRIAFDELDSLINRGQSRSRPYADNGWI